ncbi:MAG TPA: trypsin-like peptidase domain-containing protein [Thermomicrobiales bacterium]|jgi:S1-C subfamily serine protease|nr:trypsin-like peptidase domain-containing protein [Thermomicrobiales bacterium]
MTTPETPSSATLLAALSDGLADAVARAAAGTVTVYGRRRLPASGIAWDATTVITASHVVERDDDLTIGLPDGFRVPATLVGRDHGSDLAVLSAELTGVTPLDHAAATFRVGQLALAIGRAGTDDLRATFGAISTVGGAWRTINGNEVGGFVRAELTMLPGFSGGPLVTVGGQLIGMNTSAIGHDGGLTLPHSAIAPIATELREHGKVRRGYLGVATRTVDIPESLREGSDEVVGRGLMVVHVEQNGPSAGAGLVLGDVLLAIGGQAVSDAESLQRQLGPETVGHAVQVRLLRGGAVTEIPVTVGTRP